MTDLPGAGLPMSIRSAVTSSPVSSVNDAHGLGIRPKVILWIGWPVVEFMIVVVMGMQPAIAVAPAVSTAARPNVVDCLVPPQTDRVKDIVFNQSAVCADCPTSK